MGMKEYCKDLFKDQKFFFWQSQDVAKSCDSVKNQSKYDKDKDECAILNDHIFGEYHKQQKKVLNLVEEFTSSSIQKKLDKEKRLKLFVDEQ